MLPTRGRILDFHPAAGDSAAKLDDSPCTAIVALVNVDGTINAGVVDHKGAHRPRVNIPFVADPKPSTKPPYACWPPHVAEQEAKKKGDAKH